MRFPIELRKALLRNVARNGLTWSGRTSLLTFFGNIFDLDKLPSSDSRFNNARDDMWQHTVNNDDWSENDVLGDPRFDPLQLSDDKFARFIEIALSIDSRAQEELTKLVQAIRPILGHAGIVLVGNSEFGIFEDYRLSPQSGKRESQDPDSKTQTLRPAQRMSLIERISSELQQRFTSNDIPTYLGAFKFPRPDAPYNGVNSKRLFATYTLQNAPADVLIAIAEDLGLEVPRRGAAAPPANWRATSHFRLFVSHIAIHKERATRLKVCLSPYAIDAFVAHEDIEPTLEWQSEIERALQTMDAFLAIHTPGFSKSFWAQQEVGFAVGRGVKIISFQMGEDPTGFISKQQALSRRNRTAEEIAAEIDTILSKDAATADRLSAAKRAAGSGDIPF